MAEVRKKVIEDKYNTANIKKSNEKVTKTMKEKDVRKKPKEKEERKNLFVRFRIFCHGVAGEFKKVHWPSKENMVKYSIATIFFVIFCAIFFYAVDIIFAFIQSLF